MSHHNNGTQPISIYRRVPLETPSSQLKLRLLALVKGTNDEPLLARLHTASLDEDRPPNFEALSYVWGSSDSPEQIALFPGDDTDGGTETGRHASTLNITANLACALKHLRYADRDRVLWVDAICIDQSNLAERSIHVQNMANVYKMASQVIIWLGPEADDSALAIEALSNFSSKVVVDWSSYKMDMVDETTDSDLANPTVRMPFSESESDGLERLLQRPWFERLWVIQEAQKGGSRAVIVCGNSSMPWSSFIKALLCTYLKGIEKETNFGSTGKRWFFESLLDIYNPVVQLAFAHLFYSACNMDCTDDRDRIYALTPLGGVFLDELKIIPDYSLPVAEVYKDFVLKWIDFHKELDMIHGFRTYESGPSWVPAFDLIPPRTLMKTVYASSNIIADVQYLGSNKLRVAGLQCATIEGVTPIDMAQNDFESIVSCIRAVTPVDIQEQTYITGCGALLALAATLTCCKDVRYEPPSEIEWSSRGAEDLFKKALEGDAGQSYDQYDRQDDVFMGQFYRLAQGRSLATTNEGYYALVPDNTQPEDIVCTLLGLENQIVLRPTGEGEHRVIGPCFVHGLSFGEALLGDLPTGWSRILLYREDLQQYHWTFQDSDTGERQSGDPRLDEISHQKVIVGNDRKRHLKISITREELLKRGARIRDFVLV